MAQGGLFDHVDRDNGEADAARALCVAKSAAKSASGRAAPKARPAPAPDKAAGETPCPEPRPQARPMLVLNIDGGSRGNPGPAAAGWVIRDAESGVILADEGLYIGEETNNRAEYMALLFGLEDALALKSEAIVIRSDSELLVKQMNGQYRVKNEGLKGLYLRARRLASHFKSFRIQHVPREQNREADAAANRAMDEHAKAHPSHRPTGAGSGAGPDA